MEDAVQDAGGLDAWLTRSASNSGWDGWEDSTRVRRGFFQAKPRRELWKLRMLLVKLSVFRGCVGTQKRM